VIGNLGKYRDQACLWGFGKPRETSGDTESGILLTSPIHTFYSRC